MSKRNATIDLLKFLFACMIVIFHGSKNLPGQVGRVFFNGRIAVEFFFIVSGFLMVSSATKLLGNVEVETHPWLATFEFIKHKIARLLPNAIIAWFVAFTVMATAKEWSLKQTILKLLAGFPELFFLRAAGFTRMTWASSVTWYLSAMLIAMAMLYPILIRKREFFLYWLAPMATIIIYGYLSATWPNGLSGPTNWTGFATKGLLRALAGISLGGVCYLAAKRLEGERYRPSAKLLFTAVALLSLAVVIVHAWFKPKSSFDYVLILMLAISCTIIFAGENVSYLCMRTAKPVRVCAALGEFSLNIFLSHGYWSRYLGCFLNLKGRRMLLAYIIITATNAMVLMLLSNLLIKVWPSVKGRIRNWAIDESAYVET